MKYKFPNLYHIVFQLQYNVYLDWIHKIFTKKIIVIVQQTL